MQQSTRDYLIRNRFRVRTDHKSLVWMTKVDDIRARLGRWAHELSFFDFDIVYKKGVDNKVADALSRTAHKEEHEGKSVVPVSAAYTQSARTNKPTVITAPKGWQYFVAETRGKAADAKRALERKEKIRLEIDASKAKEKKDKEMKARGDGTEKKEEKKDEKKDERKVERKEDKKRGKERGKERGEEGTNKAITRTRRKVRYTS